MSDSAEARDLTEIAEDILASYHVEEAAPPVEAPGGLVGGLHSLRVNLEKISTVTGNISWVLAWVVFVLGLFNVITRYLARFIERDIIIGEIFDLQWMVFGALFLLGFNYGVREGVNPRIDFWWADFTPRRKAWIDITFHTLFFLPFCWMAITILWGYSLTGMGRSLDGTWSTWRVWQIWEQSTDAGGLPRGPIKLLMLIGFILLALQIIAEIIKNLMVLIGRDELADIHQPEAPVRIE